jgi:hypothetical protein
MLVKSLLNYRKVRKGKEPKAPYHASAAAICNDITTRDIVPTITFLKVPRRSLSFVYIPFLYYLSIR